MSLNHFVPCLCVVLSWIFCSLFLNSVVLCRFEAFLYNKTFIPYQQNLQGQCAGENLWNPFHCFLQPGEKILSYNKEALQIIRILELQPSKPVPPKSPMTASPHSEIVLAKVSTTLRHLICRHIPHSHVSSEWRLLHLEPVPDGTTRCFDPHVCYILLIYILQHLVVLLLIIARSTG